MEIWELGIYPPLRGWLTMDMGGQMKRRRADLAHLSSYSREYKTLWQRIKRGGGTWAEYLAKLRSRPKSERRCSIFGCPNERNSKLYCSKHYWRMTRHGSPHIVLKPRLEEDWYDNKVTTSILRGLGK